MAELRIDPRLVAMGYDRNRNGVVHDDLKIDASGLGGPDGTVSVEQLAAALGRDQVLVSNGFVQARKGMVNFPELPESKTIRSIYNITMQTYWWNYSITGEAMADMRSKLQAISEIANDNADFRSRKIREIANDALFRTSTSATTENLLVLKEALRHVQAIAEVPPQPTQVVKGMSDGVATAGSAIKALADQIRVPAVSGAVERARQKAAAERNAAEAVPTWQKWLIFGLFRSWSHNRAARKIEENLAALQAADPSAREQRLAALARRAYEVTVVAESVKNLDDSQKLGNDSKEIVKELGELEKDTEQQTGRIGDLLKKIAA